MPTIRRYQRCLKHLTRTWATPRSVIPKVRAAPIDVSALGITDFSQLNVSAFDPTTHESTITFSAGDEVVVHSQIALTERDFLFA